MGFKEIIDQITLILLAVLILYGVIGTAGAMGGFENFADAAIENPTAVVLYTVSYIYLVPMKHIIGPVYIPLPDILDVPFLFIAFGLALVICHFQPTWNKWIVFALLLFPAYMLWKLIWVFVFLWGAKGLGMGVSESIGVLTGVPVVMEKAGLLFPASIGLTLYQIGSKFRGIMG